MLMFGFVAATQQNVHEIQPILGQYGDSEQRIEHLIKIAIKICIWGTSPTEFK
jgi:hypothetical protein